MYRKKTDDKRFTNTQFILLAFALMLVASLSCCGQKYKSSWDCASPEGVGCSSIFYADLIARKHIILNEGVSSQNKKSAKLLIGEHYSDFEKIKTKEIEID